MGAWTIRLTAAAVSPVLGLAVAVVTPQTAAPIASTATSGVPTATELEAANDFAAVATIVAGEAGFTCTSTDALKARTALVRHVGSLDVVRVDARTAWTLAEDGKAWALKWCPETA